MATTPRVCDTQADLGRCWVFRVRAQLSIGIYREGNHTYSHCSQTPRHGVSGPGRAYEKHTLWRGDIRQTQHTPLVSLLPLKAWTVSQHQSLSNSDAVLVPY